MSRELQRWPLAEALGMAEKIRTALEPYCRQIAIAGSIRRLRPEIGDIDLVLEPRPECREAILERVKRRGRVEADGKDYARCIVTVLPYDREVQLDLWWVQPPTGDFFTEAASKWGMRLLVATGSRTHNIELAKRAKSQGKHFAPYLGILADGRYEEITRVECGPPGAGQDRTHKVQRYVDGRLVASRTEEDIFAALELEYVPPEKREAAG